MVARQCICLSLPCLFTLGCGDTAPPAGSIGHVQDYFGGASADEPEAVLIARDVLSAGGSAVDAVVAMGMTMMVTRPDAAGPGGGGMCIVFDAESGKGDAIEFLARTPRSPAPAGRWLAAAPGSFRGLFALHARYGQLRWEQLILPAERLARFGVRIPRVVTRVLAATGKSAIRDDQGRAIFFDVAGRPLKEGDVLRQVDLAATLGRIRTAGPGDFYSGPQARSFIEGVRQAGGWLEIEDLRAYRPNWVVTRPAKSGPHDVYFLPSPAAGGEVAAEIWNKLGDKGLFSSDFASADDGGKATLLSGAARQGYAAALVRPRVDIATASAGALAIDRLGNSAACVFTMDRPFGAGRIAGDTGVMAAQPSRAGAALALSAMIVANPNTEQSFFAATGAGDQLGAVAMMEVALRILDDKMEVESAMRAPRSAATGDGDGLFVEPALRSSLSGADDQVTELPKIGRVNAMSCPEGVKTRPDKCAVRTDPRGFGHAINAGF